jgi:hypothetical protein
MLEKELLKTIMKSLLYLALKAFVCNIQIIFKKPNEQ